MLWRGKTFLFKQWVGIQDRFGLYSYADWIIENEPSSDELKEQRRRAGEFTNCPLISCIIWDANHDSVGLERTLACLSAQTYDRWEACCFFPPGTIDERLKGIFNADPRIRLLDGISEGDFFINGEALTAKTYLQILQQDGSVHGEFLCFLMAGDTIAPGLFYQALERLNDDPVIDLFYADEDHTTLDNHRRHSPFFKPDWSPELLFSVNYLEFSIVRSNHFLDVCLSSEATTLFDELVMHCAMEARHVAHIAEVLIHFSDRSNNGDMEAHRNRHTAAMTRYLQKEGFSGVQVLSKPGEAPHFTWETTQPLVSIIIPTKDHWVDLHRAVESIRQLTSYSQYEFVIVDNDSSDNETLRYFEQLRSSSNVQIISFPGRFNFSAALNFGAGAAHGSILLFLNNDVQINDPAWLTELVQWALLPQVGIVGAKLLYPNGKIQHAGIVIGMEGHASHVFIHSPENSHSIFGSTDWYRNYSAVTGACMAMRRQVYTDVGGFDEGYQLVFSDVAFCLRAIQRGYRVMYNPFARLIHHEGRTRSHYISPEDILTGSHQFLDYVQKGDPFYNPNLSYAVCHPTYYRRREENRKERLMHIAQYLGNP